MGNYPPLFSSTKVGSFRCQRIAASRITSVIAMPSSVACDSGIPKA